jgi:hypothetical protein
MLNQLLTRKQQWYVFYFAITSVFWVENRQFSKESRYFNDKFRKLQKRNCKIGWISRSYHVATKEFTQPNHFRKQQTFQH